jgi:2-polyprenyl-6-methoxyphenol hydroxylase-like FAD-dependent oxidoreductase
MAGLRTASAAFLTLAVNGIEALSAIDVASKDLGGFDTPRIELFLGDGRRLTSLEFGASRPGRQVARTIRRAELYGSLRREAERRGIPVQYGKRLESAESVGGRVTARFSDGSSVEGDVLVGADGLRSRVRKILDPRAPNARYVGLLNAGGYARGVHVDGEVGTMRMFFGKRCFFGYVPAPDGEVWWFANPSRKAEPTDAELGAITKDAWRAELLDLFAGDASPACSVIEATDRIFTGWPTYDLSTRRSGIAI